MTRRTWFWLFVGAGLLVVAGITAYELIASPVQAMLLADYAKRLTYHNAHGASDSIHFPKAGPYDIRLGYVGLPEFSQRLASRGYAISEQARISPEMGLLADRGLFLPYREKTYSGLSLHDCAGLSYYSFRQPRRVYASFEAIPPLVANTLLFIENRELLDPNHPQRNPAVEWDRLAQAVLEKAMQVVQPGRNAPGGSTLATQIEKYRHSPNGLTMTATDKLRQMVSASIRAYLDGADTRVSRRRIVLDYLNTVPLAAAPGYGEVHGLGDALAAWFGLDFASVNRLLSRPRDDAETARIYKHVLALLISQRKPSWYLLSGRTQLDAQADSHLRLLAAAGIITPAFRDLALRQHISFQPAKTKAPATTFVHNKAATAARTRLAAMLGLPRLYDLDRLDLTVSTSLHARTQDAVTRFLGSLREPGAVAAAGLFGDHLLSPDNDLAKVLYSVTLFELTADGPQMRVQADSLNQPFDINQGAKLDMGSSAKLRTLITYLQIIGELHEKYRGLGAKQLGTVKVPERDFLTRWAVDYLIGNPKADLATMLRAAMGRLYSANPGEPFFTGGGRHYFVNFKKEDNDKVMDLWEATRHSVNLPFIRLMRDIVRHFIYRAPGTAGRVLEDVEDPRRQTYLMQFADREGRTFLSRFYHKYKGLKPDAATAALLNHLTANPRRLAAVYRYLEPKADPAAFTAALKSRLARPAAFDEGDFEYLYETYGPDKFNLADRAYIAQIHPLELWLVAYLRNHPDADWEELVRASAKPRIDGYEWLFKTGRKNAQDIRILSLLEIEAFQEIHQRWRKLGYPFSSLVPSYATAIGSSADRPAALAELIGVILNDGVRRETVNLNRLEFAADTPYHTVLDHQPRSGERLFPREVAQVLHQALSNVVEEGTARRVSGAFVTQRGKLTIGGKTGTGDHRFETYAANGAVLESRVVNRVATFAFFIGRHFYGVVTAFVPGAAAADYHFTSALPVQLLKSMAPILLPMIAHRESDLSWEDEVAAFEAAAAPPPKPVTRPTAPAPSAGAPAPKAAAASTSAGPAATNTVSGPYRQASPGSPAVISGTKKKGKSDEAAAPTEKKAPYRNPWLDPD